MTSVRFYSVMKTGIGAAYVAALFLSATIAVQAAPTHGMQRGHGSLPFHPQRFPESVPRPWVEGVTPSLENRLWRATYKTLPSHNILKVYVFDTTAYESAGIRFSARVPHEERDLSRVELDREAASLIRTTFEQFPQLQTLDIWATIPVPKSQLTHVQSTVFSVSADRPTYQAIRDRQLSDREFLAAFGQVWVAPEVPQ